MSPDGTTSLEGNNDPESWVDLHGNALFSYAMLRLRDRGDAEDVVQETFLAAWRSRESFHGNSTIRTWLVSILRRKIADRFRRGRREVRMTDEQISTQFDPASYRQDRLEQWSGDPAETLENREFWAVFHNCTDKLPSTLCDSYYLREVCGLSTEEVCRILEITATNLSLRVYRARAWLRQCLNRNWFRTGD